MWRRAGVVLWPATVIVLVSFVLIRIGVSPAMTRFMDNVHWTTSYVAGAWLAWLGVRTATAENRAIHRWFAWALSLYAFGQVLWDWQVAIGWNPFPGPSDLFYSCLGPGCALGLWASLRAQTNRTQLRTAMLDAGALSVALLALTLALYLPKRGDTGALALAVIVAYPVALLTALSIGVILVLTVRPRADQSWMVLLLALMANGEIGRAHV